MLWFALAFACLAVLDRIRSPRLVGLIQTATWAMLVIASLSLDSLVDPVAVWLSSHKTPLVLIIIRGLGIGSLVVATAAVTALRQAIRPRPCPGDWWVLSWRLLMTPRTTSRTPITTNSSRVFDAHAAAVYLGVSRSSVYRWVRAGQLYCMRTGEGMLFRHIQLARVRKRRPRRREAHHPSRSAA